MRANSTSITSSIFSTISKAQFGTTFYAKFLAPPKANKSIHGIAHEIVDSANTGNPLENLFLSIPTDEDLRRTYFWEARRVGEDERKRFVSRR
jgi:hypothetical protein